METLLYERRETDGFFSDSGVQLPQHDRGQFHFRHAAFASQGWSGSLQGCRSTYQLKYWWNAYYFTNTYSPITLANISSFNLVSIFRCSSSPNNPVTYVRGVILWCFLTLPDTHTCANTSCCNVYSYIICSLSGLLAYPLFYIIVFLSKYRTKLFKPPEYPLDIPRIPWIPMTLRNIPWTSPVYHESPWHYDK